VNQAVGVGSVVRPCAWIVGALKTGSFQEARRCNSRQEPDFHLQKYFNDFDMFHTPWTN